jgi:hypothetical protein
MIRKVLCFEPDHLSSIEPQAGQDGEREFLLGRDWAEYRRGGGVAWTGMKLSKIIAVGGVFTIWPGRGTAWFLMDKAFDRYDLLWLARRAKRYLTQTAPKSGLRRLEVTVRQEFRPGHLFARHLGLQYEGLLRKFDPYGHDHVLYARVY